MAQAGVMTTKINLRVNLLIVSMFAFILTRVTICVYVYTFVSTCILIRVYQSALIFVSECVCVCELWISRLRFIFLIRLNEILSHSSSSSYRTGSTDIPDPLSPLHPIVHRPR